MKSCVCVTCRLRAFIALLVLPLVVFSMSCKKDQAPPAAGHAVKEESDKAYSGNYRGIQGVVSGPNVRKNGTISLKVGDTTGARSSIKSIVDELRGQILEDSTSVNDDSSRVVRMRIKVRAENLSGLMEKIANLGTLLDMNVHAEDVSDEVARQSDQVDLLNSRLNDARKSGNAKLVDSLTGRLNEAKREKSETKKSIMYSYLSVTLKERVKLLYAFSLGINYGAEAFVWMVKAMLVAVIAFVPLGILLLFFRMLYALVKWRWKRVIAFIEGLGRGKAKGREG